MREKSSVRTDIFKAKNSLVVWREETFPLPIQANAFLRDIFVHGAALLARAGGKGEHCPRHPSRDGRKGRRSMHELVA